MLVREQLLGPPCIRSTVGWVKLVYERIDLHSTASWRHALSNAPRLTFGWHFHRGYELTLITAGTGQRFVGDSIEAYEPGDLVLLGPNLPHAYASDPGSRDNRNVVVQFRRDFLGDTFFDRPEFIDIGGLLDRTEPGLWFPSDTVAQVDDVLRRLTDQDPTDRTIALLGVLARLAESRPRPIASAGYRPSLDRATHATVDKVCHYLGAAYMRPVTLAEVAQVAHLSPAAFSRFFRRAMGRTMTAYLIELRVAAACKLLVDTDLPITDIATRAGFNNLSNFNRRFRELKDVTPRQHRAAFRDREQPADETTAREVDDHTATA